MDIRQTVHITLADQAPKIIDGYWHEWVNGEWIDSGVKAEAVAPIIIDDEWAFWNNTTLEFVKSGFSSIGDDGHSPEVREGYWWEWYPPINDYRNTGIKAEGKDGNPGADGTDGENAKTIKLTADSEVVKVNSDGSVTPSRIRVDYKATNTAVEYKEFYKNGVRVSKPTWIQDEASRNFFEIYTDDSEALFETFTIKLLDDIGNSDSITITRVKDGSDAFKHLIFGWWDENINYQISDLGIPVVKIEESVQGGFSARKLISDNYTYNESTGKGQFIESEWERVETVEFLYMQEAYIEKLQAELITAEKIEALDIKTSNLKVLNGAQIGLFNIVDDALVSEYNRVESEGGSNYNVVGKLKLDGPSINILERATTEGYEGEYIYENELTYDYTGITIRMMRDDDLTGRIERSLSINSEGIFRDGQKIL